MRTLRAAFAAARWILALSRIVARILRIVATVLTCATMVLSASVMTVAMNFPEDALTPVWTELRASPLSAYARWSAATAGDEDDDEIWKACLSDPDCINRICSVDTEREQMEAASLDRAAALDRFAGFAFVR